MDPRDSTSSSTRFNIKIVIAAVASLVLLACDYGGFSLAVVNDTSASFVVRVSTASQSAAYAVPGQATGLVPSGLSPLDKLELLSSDCTAIESWDGLGNRRLVLRIAQDASASLAPGTVNADALKPTSSC